jgi:hypothetical protein
MLYEAVYSAHYLKSDAVLPFAAAAAAAAVFASLAAASINCSNDLQQCNTHAQMRRLVQLSKFQ